MWHPLGMNKSSDSQLQTAACPLLGHKGLCYHQTHKQRLDELLEWIAVVCITRLIVVERFKRGAEFFIPRYVLIAASPVADTKGGRGVEQGAVSGTSLINVRVIGHLISPRVSHCFSWLQLIILEVCCSDKSPAKCWICVSVRTRLEHCHTLHSQR